MLAEAVGKLNVWVEPDDVMLKSVPAVLVAKACVVVAIPFNDVMLLLIGKQFASSGPQG